MGRASHSDKLPRMANLISIASLNTLLPRLVGVFERHSGLMAVLAFASGLASFFLVERRESLAQLIGALMLVSWVWLVLENRLRAGVMRRFGLELPPTAMRFATQLVHQESLFFTLPFFVATTTWSHGQAFFTILLLLCALLSLLDPIYYKQLAPRRSLFVVYHALTLFAVLLIVLPIMLKISTGQSLALALVMALLFSLPSLGDVLPTGRWRLPLVILMLTALAAGLWQARHWVPPAALRLTGIAVSQEMDREQYAPGTHIDRIGSAALLEDGLYAWTAVRAPRGLREQIHHVWLHNGVEVDRVALNIRGGREDGYRAWSHKLNFPSAPAGRWQVRVVTDSGQLVGLTRFKVNADDALTAPADPLPNEESAPELLPRLQ